MGRTILFDSGINPFDLTSNWWSFKQSFGLSYGSFFRNTIDRFCTGTDGLDAKSLHFPNARNCFYNFSIPDIFFNAGPLCEKYGCTRYWNWYWYWNNLCLKKNSTKLEGPLLEGLLINWQSYAWMFWSMSILLVLWSLGFILNVYSEKTLNSPRESCRALKVNPQTVYFQSKINTHQTYYIIFYSQVSCLAFEEKLNM